MPPDPIKHVVVLMLENHSFDQMLGGFQSIFSDLEGVDPSNLRSNRDKDGTDYSQAPTNATVVEHDPMHDLGNVLRQLEGGNQNFVLDFSKAYPETTAEERRQIMGYFAPAISPGEPDPLPALHALARHFTICDHWYSSVPGPTWANRFFAHSGTSLGRVRMPESLGDSLAHLDLYFGYNQPTIYDRLTSVGRKWRIYHGDIPQSMVLSRQRTPRHARCYQFMDVFFSDAQAKEEHFPDYCFIEPKYYLPDQDDDHPPHTTLRAQALLGRVYNALRKNKPLWNSTLLVVLYDEHGGFYDHLPPPAVVPPDSHSQENFKFDRLGVRVPALLVSPWVERTILKTDFDHTSLLRYVCEKWGLDPLTARDRAAHNFDSAIRKTGKPRDDTPESVPIPMAMMMAGSEEEEAKEPLNANQKALIAFSEYLEREIEESAGKPVRTMAMAAGPTSQAETAKERVKIFLEQQKAKPDGN